VELLVQCDEAQQNDPSRGALRIQDSWPVAEDEWPVAGLREEQFSRGGLFERAFGRAGGVGKFPHECGHAGLRHVEVR